MEGLFRELHHFMTFCPWVEAQVHQWRRNEIGQWGQGGGGIVDATTAVERTHALTHQFLLGVSRAELIQLLAPLVDLITQVDLDRANRLATVTQRAGTDITRVLLSITQHTEVDADRTRNEIAVTIATTTTIDGTGVHT